MKRMAWIVIMVVLTGVRCWAADVTSLAINAAAARGLPIDIPIKISSTKAVAGLNGEFAFNPSVFTNPQIRLGNGMQAFQALGNLVSPGKFRFVIYSDPTATINTANTVAYIQVTVLTTVQVTSNETLSYTSALCAASDPNAVSLTTDLKSATVRVGGNAVGDWAIYE